MRYHVVLQSTNSVGADVKRIVRGRNQNDAIKSLVKSENLHRVYAAYAYPVRGQRQGPCADDWRHNIRCFINGKFTMLTGLPPVMAVKQPNAL